MKTLYLDHNIIHYFVAGFPTSFDSAGERAALDSVRENPDRFRIALSHWNLLEASREGPRKRVVALADFIDGLNPMWLSDRLPLELLEMQNFVYREFYGAAWRPVSAFAEYFSQVVSDFSEEKAHLGLGLTGGRFAILLHDQDSRLREMAAAENRHPTVLAMLQQAYADGKMNRETRRLIEQKWFRKLVPTRCPSGRPIPPHRLDEMAELCANKAESVRTSCPAIAAEHFLSEFRMKNKGKQERQSAIDLMHTVPALAYCDAFVTNEPYLVEAARQCCKRMAMSQKTFRSLRQAISGSDSC